MLYIMLDTWVLSENDIYVFPEAQAIRIHCKGRLKIEARDGYIDIEEDKDGQDDK